MVTLKQLIADLAASPTAEIQIRLPDGGAVAPHFHVTEVGRVRKDYVDCGGTMRSATSCVLQVWVANDLEHRLNAAKLAGIIGKGAKLFDTTDVPLEIEYDTGAISQYPVQEMNVSPAGLVLQLTAKHTACQAPDRCGVKLDVLSACSTSDCC